MIFVGIDWAEAHHDICVLDESGGMLAKRRIAEGLEGVRQLHALLAEHATEPQQVVIGTETDRGLLVGALVAAGYQVYAINPLAASHRRTGRERGVAQKAATIQAELRAAQLAAPALVGAAYGTSVASTVRLLRGLNVELARLEAELAPSFEKHPDAEIYRSLPGLGIVLGARVLSEFGDDRTRFAHPRARRNYAGNSPITKTSGARRVVLAR